MGIPEHWGNVALDTFVVMPDHIHGILWILAADRQAGQWADVGATHASPLLPCTQGHARRRAPSLSRVIGSFTSAVAREVNHLRDTPGSPARQRGFL